MSRVRCTSSNWPPLVLTARQQGEATYSLFPVFAFRIPVRTVAGTMVRITSFLTVVRIQIRFLWSFGSVTIPIWLKTGNF